MQKAIEELAIEALGEHGYLFQHRCLAEIREKAGDHWALQAEEYPVSTGTDEILIDFVLSLRGFANGYFVFECKRAHPKYLAWIFADTLIHREHTGFLATLLQRPGDIHFTGPSNEAGFSVGSQNLGLLPPREISQCNVSTGLEVSLGEKVQRRRSQSDTIRDACTQVMKGIAGLLREQQRQLQKTSSSPICFYIPIVVTTAQLFIAKYVPTDVELATGTVELSKTRVTPIRWVFYDVPVRESAEGFPVGANYLGADPRALRQFKKRTAIIVTGLALVRLLNSIRHVLVP